MFKDLDPRFLGVWGIYGLYMGVLGVWLGDMGYLCTPSPGQLITGVGENVFV